MARKYKYRVTFEEAGGITFGLFLQLRCNQHRKFIIVELEPTANMARLRSPYSQGVRQVLGVTRSSAIGLEFDNPINDALAIIERAPLTYQSQSRLGNARNYIREEILKL